jgi:integrase
VSLCDIRPIDVRGWHRALSHGSLHQNTIAKIYRLFRTLMSTAVEDDLLRQNPVRIKGASTEQIIERPLLTWNDVRELAGAIHPRLECLVGTAAASGLRFGELAGLSVDHDNLDRSDLRVSRAPNDIKRVGPRLAPPKTDRAVRTVAIPEAITLRLVVHIDQYADDAQSDSLVFTSLRGGPLLNTYFAPRWSKVRSEVGLPMCASTTSATSPGPRPRRQEPRFER